MARSILPSLGQRFDEPAAVGSAHMPIGARKVTLALLLVSFIGISGPARAAGTIPGLSMTQQLDEFAKPLSGGKLFLVQVGTVGTPQNCYQDAGLTLPWPNPITLDASGRVPQLFCADGSIKIRLTDRNGVQKLVQDGLLIVGPSGGGGGGSPVDPTTIAATGDLKSAYGTSILSGWVRANGRSIGSATSGATERANADTSALFVYLWGADANLVVSGGRGASGAADFAANKTIALPDLRGRGISGLDDMGNSPAGRLTAGFFASPTTLGASGGSQSQTLATSNLPPYTPSGTGTATTDSDNYTVSTNNNASGSAQAGGSQISVPGAPGGGFGKLRSNGSISFTGAAQGGTSSAFGILPPMMLATYYLKL